MRYFMQVVLKKQKMQVAIWSQIDIPYLRAVDNVEDESYDKRTSTNVISYATFKNTLIDNGYITDLSIDDFKIYILMSIQKWKSKDNSCWIILYKSRKS